MRHNAGKCIDKNDSEFELTLAKIHDEIFTILWRQDWFVIDLFNHFAGHPAGCQDMQRFQELVAEGQRLKQADRIADLKRVLAEMVSLAYNFDNTGDIRSLVNIIRG